MCIRRRYRRRVGGKWNFRVFVCYVTRIHRWSSAILLFPRATLPAVSRVEDARHVDEKGRISLQTNAQLPSRIGNPIHVACAFLSFLLFALCNFSFHLSYMVFLKLYSLWTSKSNLFTTFSFIIIFDPFSHRFRRKSCRFFNLCSFLSDYLFRSDNRWFIWTSESRSHGRQLNFIYE